MEGEGSSSSSSMPEVLGSIPSIVREGEEREGGREKDEGKEREKRKSWLYFKHIKSRRKQTPCRGRKPVAP